MKIGARVQELWLDTSLGPWWPKCCFWAPGPKVKKFVEISWFYWIHLMILEKMRSCLWKLELGFWAYSLICLLPKALGPNCPKLVLRFKNFFMSSSIKFCMKQALIFKFWVTFDSYECLFPENCKKDHQKSSFWCHSRYNKPILKSSH